MRIVAGKYGSRPLKTLAGNQTRPTLDKVKEAVFSKVGPYFDGGACLDLFSGSGAIGLECLSRGMDEAWLCDINYAAINVIKENVKSLNATGAKVLKKDYKQVLNSAVEQKKQFDIIYLDPPYKEDFMEKILSVIDENHLVKSGGWVIVETLKERELPEVYQSMELNKSVVYGISKIRYFRGN